MRKSILNIIILLSVLLPSICFSGTPNGEIVITESGQKVLLKENGTWEYVKGEKGNDGLVTMDLQDFILDEEQYKNQIVKIGGGIVQFVFQKYFTLQSIHRQTISIVSKKLSRAERKRLQACRGKCRITVIGQVKPV